MHLINKPDTEYTGQVSDKSSQLIDCITQGLDSCLVEPVY